MSSSPTQKINRLVGRAMHTYSMLAEGDRVMVAVSGGVDSLALAWLLFHWRDKAPIHYDLLAVHLNMGFDSDGHEAVEQQLQHIGIPYLIEHTTIGAEAYANKEGMSVCFTCARNRRNRLFQMATERQYSKIALGHHKDDIIETFFLNMLYSGNISTMVPRQDLFNKTMAIIRPLAFLEKDKVIQMATAAGLRAVKNPCPNADHSKREEVRSLLTSLFSANPEFRDNIFASLSNVRHDYLLKKPCP